MWIRVGGCSHQEHARLFIGVAARPETAYRFDPHHGRGVPERKRDAPAADPRDHRGANGEPPDLHVRIDAGVRQQCLVDRFGGKERFERQSPYACIARWINRAPGRRVADERRRLPCRPGTRRIGGGRLGQAHEHPERRDRLRTGRPQSSMHPHQRLEPFRDPKTIRDRRGPARDPKQRGFGAADLVHGPKRQATDALADRGAHARFLFHFERRDQRGQKGGRRQRTRDRLCGFPALCGLCEGIGRLRPVLRNAVVQRRDDGRNDRRTLQPTEGAERELRGLPVPAAGARLEDRQIARCRRTEIFSEENVDASRRDDLGLSKGGEQKDSNGEATAPKCAGGSASAHRSIPASLHSCSPPQVARCRGAPERWGIRSCG